MKIMILSTVHTGLGHNSIACAIRDALCYCDVVDGHNKTNKIVECKIIDMIELCGAFFRERCKMYGKITKKAPKLWGLLYSLSNSVPGITNVLAKSSCQKNFFKELIAFMPDCIVSVHPLFVGSIIDILESIKNKTHIYKKYSQGTTIQQQIYLDNLKCKFVVVLADLVSINNLWLDSRVDLLICSTPTSRQIAVNKGIDNNKILSIKLPSRTQIVQVAKENITTQLPKSMPIMSNIECAQDIMMKSKKINKKLSNKNATIKPMIVSKNAFRYKFTCVLMSGGEGSGSILKIIQTLLSLSYLELIVVCGKNKNLYDKCRGQFKQYNNIKIFGFVDDIAKVLKRANIAIVRGSPNTIMECINLLVPIIVVATLPGQEKGNDSFVLNNGLGVVCKDIDKLPECIDTLIKNDGLILKTIRLRQAGFRDLTSAITIANAIKELVAKFK